MSPNEPMPIFAVRNASGGFGWWNTEPMRFFDWDDNEPFFNYGTTSTTCCKCCNTTCVSDTPPPPRTPAPYNASMYNISIFHHPFTQTTTLSLFDPPWYPTITCTHDYYPDGRTNCTNWGCSFGSCSSSCVTYLATSLSASESDYLNCVHIDAQTKKWSSTFCRSAIYKTMPCQRTGWDASGTVSLLRTVPPPPTVTPWYPFSNYSHLPQINSTLLIYGATVQVSLLSCLQWDRFQLTRVHDWVHLAVNDNCMLQIAGTAPVSVYNYIVQVIQWIRVMTPYTTR